MPDWIHALLQTLALPEVGLGTVFVVAFISATLLPLGSEPAVFALVKLNPELFWPAILVATAGNTLGGMVSWLMGYGAHRAVGKCGTTPPSCRHGAGWSASGPKPACWPGCPAWGIRCAPWLAG